MKQGDDSKQGTGSDSSDSTEKPYSQDGDKSKNIYIQFNNNVLFMPDEAVLRDDSYEVMEFLGECLQKVEPDIALIIIKGHTAISPTSVVDSRLLSQTVPALFQITLKINMKYRLQSSIP